MGLHRRQVLIFGTAFLAVAGCGARSDAEVEQGPATSNRPDEPQNLDPLLPPRKDVRIVVMSDLNSQYGSTEYEPEVAQAIALIRDWKPDLVLCGGDMVAGQKQELSDENVRAMWQGFDQQVRSPLTEAQIPFAFTIGNHDGSGAVRDGSMIFERDRHIAQTYWHAPAHKPNLNFVDRTQFPFYYSFVQNEVFYLVWDASTAALGEEQLAWVEQSLASEAAKTARLRLAIGHLPLYPIAVNRDRPGEFLHGGEGLRSLLEKYNVHTYVSGHQHAYYPAYRGNLQLLYAGAIGGGPRLLLAGDRPAQKTITVVDMALSEAGQPRTVYTTFVLPSLERLEQQVLPEQITTVAGTVFRRDQPQ